jgi:hypothetical protein
MLKSFLNDDQPPSMILRVLAVIAALIFLRAGVTEIIAPAGWDKSFGVPLQSPDGLAFVQAVGARNAAISLIAISGAIAGSRGIMFLCFAAISLIAAMDFYIVKSAGLTTEYIKHGTFVVVLALAAVWTASSGKTKAPA